MIHLLAYTGLWLSFGLVHSVLTVFSVKSRLEPVLGSAYRLSYNLFAVFHLAIVFFLGKMLLDTRESFLPYSEVFTFFMSALSWSGMIVLLIGLKQYDLGRFSGLSQLRKDYQEKEDEPLNTEGLNRWVRHPLYTGAFMYLWGNAQSSFGFWTAVFASVYLIIGSRYEEKKLLVIYGNDYRDYQARVPAFFPWKVSPD